MAPSVRYMNQSAPFWDFVASLENQGSEHPFFGGQARERDNSSSDEEAGQGSDNPWGWGFPFGGPRQRGWGWGGHPGRHPWHHHGPPPPAPSGPEGHGDEKRKEGEGDGEGDGEKEGEEKPPGYEDGEPGPSGPGRRHRGPVPNIRGGPWGGRGGHCGGRRGRDHSHGFDHHRRRGAFPPPPGFRIPPGARGIGGPLGDFIQSQFFGNDAEENKDKAQDFSPDVDVFDTETAFVVHASLPGAKKEDIDVSWDAEKSELSITGVTFRAGDEEFLKTLALDERRVGAFERKVRLGTRAQPAQVEREGIQAKLEDGVLFVKVPKLGQDIVEVMKVDID